MERDRTRPSPFLGRKRKTILTDGACCKNLVILKKRIKIQEHVIESAESYPVIFFRGGCTTAERCEVWPVRPTGALSVLYSRSLVCYTALFSVA